MRKHPSIFQIECKLKLVDWEFYHSSMSCSKFQDTMKAYHASDGMSIYDHTQQSAMLIVFLKSIGCPFCQRTVQELVPQRRSLEQSGVRLLFVHMGTPDQGKKMLEENGMERPLHVSDPDQRLYQLFELQRSFARQIFSPRVWVNKAKLYFTKSVKVNEAAGDINQMPGAFLVHKGVVERGYRHKYISDRPDYFALADSDGNTDPPTPSLGR
ncbi:MAG: hypothetical protein COA73_09615 [Candidatus Hydrogenedentota bacterium]|nr:MAG: hypothetical protein COA73_09615 [Candidatus Hydrogenedentota bacterium]